MNQTILKYLDLHILMYNDVLSCCIGLIIMNACVREWVFAYVCEYNVCYMTGSVVPVPGTS